MSNFTVTYSLGPLAKQVVERPPFGHVADLPEHAPDKPMKHYVILEDITSYEVDTAAAATVTMARAILAAGVTERGIAVSMMIVGRSPLAQATTSELAANVLAALSGKTSCVARMEKSKAKEVLTSSVANLSTTTYLRV